MIRKIEEIRPEPKAPSLAERERLADCEVQIPLIGTNEAVPRSIAVSRRAVRPYNGRRHKRGRIQPIAEARIRTARRRRIRATEPGSKTGGDRGTASQIRGRSACGIVNRERRAGLERQHTAHFPAS